MGDNEVSNLFIISDKEIKELKAKGIQNPSRRKFLRLIPPTAAGLLTASCASTENNNFVLPTVAAVATTNDRLTLPIATPDINVSKEKRIFNFEDINFSNREGNNDRMHVLGWTNPLKPHEVEQYIESRDVNNLPPVQIRTPEIFVGHEALTEWQKGNRANGENILSYLKYHFSSLPNNLLAKTRPEIGISNMKAETDEFPVKVVIVDEQWLKNYPGAAYGSVTTQYNSGDVYARYLIPQNYIPNSPVHDPLTGHVIEAGIVHEQMHHSFYLDSHPANFFLDLENWRSYPKLPSAENIVTSDIKLWKLSEMKHEFRSLLLQNSEYFVESTSPFAVAEELFIKRATLSLEKHTSFNEIMYSFFNNKFGVGEISNRYNINLADSSVYEARLYTATLDEKTGFDNFKWNFDNQPINLNVDNGAIVLDGNLLTGNISKTNDPSFSTNSPRAFLLVTGQGDQQKVYGFSSYHLLSWHYHEQNKNGVKLGKDGQTFPVDINLGNFE